MGVSAQRRLNILRTIVAQHQASPITIIEAETKVFPELASVWEAMKPNGEECTIQWSDGDYSFRMGDEIYLSPFLMDVDQPATAILLRLKHEFAHVEATELSGKIEVNPGMTKADFVRLGLKIATDDELRSISAEIELLPQLRKAGIKDPQHFLAGASLAVYQSRWSRLTPSPKADARALLSHAFHRDMWIKYLEDEWDQHYSAGK